MKSLFRRGLERLARGRTFWRRLPSEFLSTSILVSPDARLQHLKIRGGWDNDLLDLVRQWIHPDSVVWDIGANVGVFSFAAASRCSKHGQVLALEPDSWLCSLLRKSCSHVNNNQLKLDVICAALADKPGIARLAVAQRGRASNYLEEYSGRSMAGGVRETQSVPVLTLDILLESLAAPTFVKIDVEGAEWAVLQGGSNMIKTHRPVIAIEVGANTRIPVTEYLKSLNYELRNQKQGTLLNDSIEPVSNIIAIPQDVYK